MADPKILGSLNAVAQSVAVMPRGIGFPLIEVDGSVGPSDATQIFVAESFANQGPTAVNTPHQINFGPAVNTPADPVMIDANGVITINQDGSYLWQVSLFPSRASNPGTALLFFRVLKNSVQNTNPVGVELSESRTTIPVFLAGAVQAVAGDTYTVEMYRDSGGINDGSLESLTATLAGWGSSPSARLKLNAL